MKKLNAKRLAALAMTLVMLLGVLTACGDKADTNNGSGDGEGFPTMTIQIAHVNPTTDDDQYNKLATLFAEKVTAATDGAVTFEICGNSELGGEADVLTGFDLGTHQMGIITNGSYGNLYGPSLVVELPFIFKDNETAWNFLDGDIMKEVTDGLYDTLGYKVLAWGEGGFRNILPQKPIRTPADLKGMKIRVPGMEMFMATFQTIGAAPSALDFNETFTAVQQHLMDGLELPIASAYTGSYYEICDYYDMTGHFYNAISLSCSKSFWESLSPELQEIFLTAAKEAGAEQRTWLQTPRPICSPRWKMAAAPSSTMWTWLHSRRPARPCTRPIVTRSAAICWIARLPLCSKAAAHI